METSTSLIDWVNFGLALAALIIGLILIFWTWSINNNLLTHGIGWRIQNGSTDSTQENMKTGGNNLYIANRSSIQIVISSNSGNTKGREIAIKNDTANNVTIDTTNLSSYDSGKVSQGNKVSSGHTASFVFTGKNQLLRLS